MTETNETPNLWARQKSEPNSNYALFSEYLLIGPLRTLPKLREKVKNNEEFDTTPSLSNLGNISSKWNWPERAAAYDLNQIEEKRSTIEARATQRLINRLDKSEEIEDEINKKMLAILKDEDFNKNYSKNAYAVSELSKSKKVELESQRLDLGEPTIIQKQEVKADVKTEEQNKRVEDIEDILAGLKRKEGEEE